MEIDNYVINDGEKDLTIYPVLEMEIAKKNYLIYTNELKENYDKNDLYVGEIKGESINPIDEHLLPMFDIFINNIINKNAK